MVYVCLNRCSAAPSAVPCVAWQGREAAGRRLSCDTCMCSQDTLFADMAIYEYMAHEQLAITAWYVAKEFSDAFDVGMDAASKLAAKFPDDKEKADNLAWFEKLREGGTPFSIEKCFRQ